MALSYVFILKRMVNTDSLINLNDSFDFVNPGSYIILVITHLCFARIIGHFQSPNFEYNS
jgi:hypothetical protein